MGRRIEWAPGPAWVCLPLFALYVLTAGPGPGWRDNPEFAVSAATLGVAHPLGFPTYSLTVKLLTWLPLADLPFRATLGSALFAALALYFLFELIRRQGESEASASWAAAGAALVLGLTPTFWTNATQIEVYTLNLAFLGGVFVCVQRWASEGNEVWLYAAALVYGLASGNHGTMALYLPGLLAFAIRPDRPGLARRLGLAMLCFLVGLSVYLYLPVRAAAGPAMDFGHPATWQRFWMHVTDRKDAASHFAAIREGFSFAHYAWIFLSRTTPVWFWPVGAPLFLVGLWTTWGRDRGLALALVWVLLIDSIFFIKWTNDASAFLPAAFSASLLAGVGASRVLAAVGPSRSPSPVYPAAALVLVLALGLRAGLPDHDRSGLYLSGETFRADFENLAPDAVSLTGLLWFHQRAFQDLYRLRDDVTVMSFSDFFAPQWFNPVTRTRFPRVEVPAPAAGPYDGDACLGRFLTANLDQGRMIYFEPYELEEGVYSRNLLPAGGLLLRVTFRPVEQLDPARAERFLLGLRNQIGREVESDGFLTEPDLHRYYFRMLPQYASYFQQHARPRAAMALLDLTENLFGPQGADSFPPRERAPVLGDIGLLHLNAGRADRAAGYLEKALNLDPYDANFRAALGLARLFQGRLPEAREALERAVELAPDDPLARVWLGRYHRQAGNAARARECEDMARSLAATSRKRAEVERWIGGH